MTDKQYQMMHSMELDRLRMVIQEAYNTLMNAQPHIAQGIERGDLSAKFLDSDIDMAMEALQRAVPAQYVVRTPPLEYRQTDIGNFSHLSVCGFTESIVIEGDGHGGITVRPADYEKPEVSQVVEIADNGYYKDGVKQEKPLTMEEIEEQIENGTWKDD